MEEKQKPHNLTLSDRNRLVVTQVSDVDTFDENKIILFTEEDTLEIEGDDLHIQKLDINSGELCIDGEIMSIVYSNKNYQKQSKGFLKKLLK